MKIYENPKVRAWAFRQISKKFTPRKLGEPLHASDIYACFRKTYLARHTPPVYSEEDQLRFMIGFAVQEYFFGPEKDGDEIFGIILSADKLIKGHVMEFKTTRMSYEALPKDPETGKGIRGAPKVKFDPQNMDGWILRTKAYCAEHNVKKGHILVFFLFNTILVGWTLEFTDAELRDAREDIEARRDVMQGFLDREELPGIETRTADFECSYCPFYTKTCQGELAKAGVHIDFKGD